MWETDLRPFRVHSTEEFKDFARFHSDGVNLIYVGPMFFKILSLHDISHDIAPLRSI